MSHAAGTSIERSVLHYVKDEGWGGLSSMKTGKERVPISTCESQETDKSSCPSWVTTSANILAFTGAYRKVLIDYLVTQYIARLDADAAILAEYATFLKGRKLGQVVRYTAFGTDNPTSDYDVTLSGPRVHDIVQHLMVSFKKLTTYERSMAFVFDSNFYIVPELLVPLKLPDMWPAMWTKSNFKLFRPYVCSRTGHGHRACSTDCTTDAAACEVAVPVPDGQIIDMEWDEILTKLRQQHATSDAEVLAKYAELVRLGAALDAFVYKGQEAAFSNKEAFFRHLFAMKRTSIESYIGVSTVMAVVYGMQGGKMRCVRNVMTTQNFENACLENVIDFTNHWNDSLHAATSFGDSESLALRVFVKLSKYLQRVIVCIDNARENEDAQETATYDDETLIPGDLRKFVDETVASRSSLALKGDVTSDQLAKFGCIPRKKIDLELGGSGFVHTVFQRLRDNRKAARARVHHSRFGRLVV
jgi:hypothetical protein